MPSLARSLDLRTAFAVFDRQDSGCVSYGVEAQGRRWSVKTPATPAAADSLRRAVRFHQAVHHPAIVRPVEVLDSDGIGFGRVDVAGGPVLVYPWRDGEVLCRATVEGVDRSALARFRRLPVAEVEAALARVLDAHLAVADAGFVAVDLYDGCFLYGTPARTMWLVDLDEHRPGPFVLDADRLPGSRRYMAPEEHVRGATIDERTTVHLLGRTLHHLLDSDAGWRGSAAQRAVVDRACAPAASDRYAGVAALQAAWSTATTGASVPNRRTPSR